MVINLNGQIVKQQITVNDLGSLESGTFHYHIMANGQKLSGTLFKTK